MTSELTKLEREKEVSDALRDIAEILEYRQVEIDRLRYQLSQYDILVTSIQDERDELLAAAKFFMRAEGDYDLIKAGKLFQAAIASVKGGA